MQQLLRMRARAGRQAGGGRAADGRRHDWRLLDEHLLLRLLLLVLLLQRLLLLGVLLLVVGRVLRVLLVLLLPGRAWAGSPGLLRLVRHLLLLLLVVVRRRRGALLLGGGGRKLLAEARLPLLLRQLLLLLLRGRAAGARREAVRQVRLEQRRPRLLLLLLLRLLLVLHVPCSRTSACRMFFGQLRVCSAPHVRLLLRGTPRWRCCEHPHQLQLHAQEEHSCLGVSARCGDGARGRPPLCCWPTISGWWSLCRPCIPWCAAGWLGSSRWTRGCPAPLMPASLRSAPTPSAHTLHHPWVRSLPPPIALLTSQAFKSLLRDWLARQ